MVWHIPVQAGVACITQCIETGCSPGATCIHTFSTVSGYVSCTADTCMRALSQAGIFPQTQLKGPPPCECAVCETDACLALACGKGKHLFSVSEPSPSLSLPSPTSSSLLSLRMQPSSVYFRPKDFRASVPSLSLPRMEPSNVCSRPKVFRMSPPCCYPCACSPAMSVQYLRLCAGSPPLLTRLSCIGSIQSHMPHTDKYCV